MGPVDVSVLPTLALVGIRILMRNDHAGIFYVLGLCAPSGPEWNYSTRGYISDAPLAPLEFADLYRNAFVVQGNTNNELTRVIPYFNYSHSMLSDNTFVLTIFYIL